MPACPACDATLPEGSRACQGCGTLATLSLDRAKGGRGQATRTADAVGKDLGLLRATGVEAATAERLIEKTDAALRDGQFGPAVTFADAARRAVKIARTRARLQNDLARSEEAIRAAKRGGADTIAPEKALQEAATRLESGDLKAVPTWLKKASVRAMEEQRVHSVESVLSSSEKVVRYAKERGADVVDAEQELAKAREALRAKEYDAAREAASRAKHAADHARKASRYEKFVAGADHTLELAKKSGASLQESRRLLTEARHALKDGLFAEAQRRAAEAKEAVAEAKRYRAAEVLVERAEKTAKKEERRGINMSGPGLVLVEAHQALDAHEYRKVRELARDAREAVKEAIVARRLQITLTALATDIEELKTVGADPNEAQTFLGEASNALEAHDFDKSRRLAQRARRAADDARDSRRQEILIDTVQKIVAAAAAGGHADAATVRDLIQDVEAMLASGEAVDVDALVRARLTVVDAEKLKEATRRLGDVRLMLLELKRADIDIAGADDSIALAGVALDEGRFDQAEQQITELEEVAKTLIETLRESATDTIQNAELAADKARKAEIPIPDAIRMLNSARAAMEAGKIYEALEFGRIAQARAESAWKKHFEEEAKRDVEAMRLVAERVKRSRDRIDVLLSHIEYLTGIGADVGPARDSLGSAQKALSQKRIDEVEAHLAATERIVEGMRGALRKNAEDALERVRKNVLEARAQGLMTAEMEAVMQRAEQAVNEDQYREALDSIRALEEAIEHAQEEREAERHQKELERAKKSSDRFVRVKRMIEELKKANIDIAGSDEALLHAEKALQSRDFESVDELLGDLETTAREMRAELVAATKFLLQKAREAVEAAERSGVDVTEAKRLLENADGFLIKGRLDDAVESANTAKQRVDALSRLKTEEEARKERIRIETARQKIDRIKLVVEDLHRADISIDGAEDAIKSAEDALSAKRYEDVHLALAETETLAESLEEGLKSAAEQLIARSRESVEAAKKEGLNVRRADMVLVNAVEAIRSGRYVEAIEYHKVIDDIVGDASRLRHYQGLEAEVQVLRTELARAAALGGDVGAPEDLLKKAQEEVSLGRFDRVEEYTEQLRKALTITREQILQAKLDRARVAIGKAQMLGSNLPDAEQLLADAEKAAESGSYEALDVLVRRIEERSREATRETLAAKAEEDFLSLESLAKTVEESGMDMSQAREFLEEARKLKDERKYESMLELVSQARRTLEESGREKVASTYRDKMRGLSAMLEAAKRIGANVSEPERILQQAEQALGTNDLTMADILVKQAEMSTGLQIQSFIQNKYPNLTLRAPTSGLQANAWNRYTVEIANKGAIAAKNIDLKFEGDVEVRGVEPIPELGIDETKAIEVGIKPTKEGDVPLNVRVFYQRYFDDNQYETSDARQLKVESAGTYLVEDVFLIHVDGRLISHESRKFRQEIDEDIFSGMLTVVQDFIRDSFRQRTQTSIKRLDFGQSKILIERSKHCFLTAVVLGEEPALLPLYMAEVLREIESRFGNILEAWTGMLHELPGVDDIIRKLVLVTQAEGADRGALGGSEVAEVERMLTEAKEAGAETNEVEELLAKAENSLETDMELAWQLLSKAKVSVQESQQKFVERMKLLVDQTTEAVENLRHLGTDAGPAEILLKEAREAFTAGQYEKLEEIADNVRGTLERAQQETMAKQVETELSDLIQSIERARGEGVDVSRAEAFLVKIEDALQRKNFRGVEDHMRRARDILEEERKKSITRRSHTELDKLTQMLVEAKAFGAEAREAEALLMRAREAMADHRVDDLDALVRQATTVAKQKVQQYLEGRYPRLFLSMPTSGLQADVWNKFVLELANKGNLAAKDVHLNMEGGVEIRGLNDIPRIDPNEKKRLEIGLRPKSAGQVPIDVEIRYERPLDDKQYELTDSREFKVEQSGTYLVEDVFLIHRDGRLITHETRRFRDAMDEDIYAGMLTVVTDYVKKTLQARAGTGLKRLDFGNNKILFERSPNVYLAATVLGGEPVILPIYMVDTLADIEERFGPRLEKWTGFLTELDGIVDLVRRLLYVTEVGKADLGPLAGSPLSEALRLVQEGEVGTEGADFVQEAREVIESKDFAEAAAFVRKAVRSYTSGREELHAQLREAVVAHGQMTGLQLTDDEMKEYIDTVRRVVEAIFGAREKAGMDRVWPVKRVAVKVDNQDAMDAVTSFRKIIVNQSQAKELDIVGPGETWRGLQLTLNLDGDAISRAYRLWARKIEILLRSQDAWKIKSGIDKGEYSVGIEGQKVRIDPTMVWFTEAVPDNVVAEPFEGGTIYIDTEMTEDIMAEGYAKELVTIIRDVRQELKLPLEVWIETKIRASESLNKLLRKWKDFISTQTNTQALRFVRGDITDGYVVECNLGSENFTISVKPMEGLVSA